MCARYEVHNDVIRVSYTGTQIEFSIAEAGTLFPKYEGPVIVPSSDGLEIRKMHWGFLRPDFKKQGQLKALYNARSETAHEKKTFKTAFAQRRCLIPCNGFYEWTPKRVGAKQSLYYFNLPNRESFLIAGLWEPGNHEKDRPECYTMLTTTPNEVVSSMGHDRMPVILKESFHDAWLTARPPDLEQKELYHPYEERTLTKKIAN